MKEDRHILTMLVENEPGVTARVSGLFASRGYNIETICGAPTANPKMSRITISTRANPEMLERIMKQLRRLVNVIKVRDMTGEEAVKREMALVCVKARPKDIFEMGSNIVTTNRGRYECKDKLFGCLCYQSDKSIFLDINNHFLNIKLHVVRSLMLISLSKTHFYSQFSLHFIFTC